MPLKKPTTTTGAATQKVQLEQIEAIHEQTDILREQTRLLREIHSEITKHLQSLRGTALGNR